MGDLKRRDHKGRILNNGEYQEQDGSYTYRYTECGKRKKLKSWRLTSADPIPSGKKSKIALREKRYQKTRNTSAGTPLCYLYWENYFRNICAKYNKTYPETPLKVTPHICNPICFKYYR